MTLPTAITHEDGRRRDFGLRSKGLVWINGWDACDFTMPFGGFKQSAFGRGRSRRELHKYADLKSVSLTLRPPK